ncbi:hypothetical protein DLAC_04645 [Tieghemostelium lacteum]|uniref:Phytanoyl-CoA dioxygenase n=1 Tax=Tieghemostelium lacteum TaxID=361077 RepID=A0A151ZKB4_TIELA|nr:hypothetical protein DLAC_04645 [Tieghemostelium lacteum]|eukprot:KYQ94349.1 hypothetical protein DLAC_04645 [Tieghemostelium lacteum]
MATKNFFKENSFVILKDFIKEDVIKEIKNEIYIEIIKLLDILYKQNLISGQYKNDQLSADEKLLLAESEYIGTTILLHTRFASRLPKFIGEYLFRNTELLQVISELLESTEISGHPEWNVRCKTPSNRYFEVPWHQDTAYLSKGSEIFNQITCWLTLVDINDTVLGPLELIPKALSDKTVYKHQLEKLKNSQYHDSWYLEVPVEEIPHTTPSQIITGLGAGSIVLFSNLTLHKSLPNLSKQKEIRWTIDIRFQKTQDPSGFYPLDQSNNETKMKLTTSQLNSNDNNNTNTNSNNSIVPLDIDYQKWSNESNLMTKDNVENNEEDLSNYSIEGPWFDRWLVDK